MKPATIFFISLIGFLFPGLALAIGVSTEGHSFEQDPALYYALRIVLIFDILGILTLIYCFVTQKGGLSKTSAKILTGVGVVVLPTITVALGNLVALENAKTVDFCNSCHEAMNEYVLDMREPTNLSISAIHYKNRWINRDQCFGCHTGYGLLGSINAKAKGLKDVYKYYTGTWEKPIKMYKPFPNKDCLKCHHQAKSYVDSKIHQKNLDKIASDEIVCSKCHNPMHGRKEAKKKKEGPSNFF